MMLSISNQIFSRKSQSSSRDCGTKASNPSFVGRLSCVKCADEILQNLAFANVDFEHRNVVEKLLTSGSGALDQLAQMLGVDIEISSKNMLEGNGRFAGVSKFIISIKNDAAHAKRKFNSDSRIIIVQNGAIARKGKIVRNQKRQNKIDRDIATVFKLKCDEMIRPLVDMCYGKKS